MSLANTPDADGRTFGTRTGRVKATWVLSASAYTRDSRSAVGLVSSILLPQRLRHVGRLLKSIGSGIAGCERPMLPLGAAKCAFPEADSAPACVLWRIPAFAAGRCASGAFARLGAKCPDIGSRRSHDFAAPAESLNLQQLLRLAANSALCTGKTARLRRYAGGPRCPYSPIRRSGPALAVMDC
jgi:hypothetical protein